MLSIEAEREIFRPAPPPACRGGSSRKLPLFPGFCSIIIQFKLQNTGMKPYNECTKTHMWAATWDGLAEMCLPHQDGICYIHNTFTCSQFTCIRVAYATQHSLHASLLQRPCDSGAMIY